MRTVQVEVEAHMGGRFVAFEERKVPSRGGMGPIGRIREPDKKRARRPTQKRMDLPKLPRYQYSRRVVWSKLLTEPVDGP